MNLRNYYTKFFHRFDSKIYHYALSVMIIGVATLICFPLANTQNYHVVSFILLFVVSILSTFMSVGPVLLASTLSAVVWNFFFIPPHHTFHIEKTEDILIFGLFFIIALVNGVLTTRVRRQELIAREREKRTNALFQLTKELTKAGGTEHVMKVAGDEINSNFNIIPYFLLQDGNGNLSPSQTLPGNKKLSTLEYHAAEWVFEHLQKAGAFTDNSFGITSTIYPLIGSRLNPGILAIRQDKPFAEEQQSYWDTFLSQISNALEREFLGEMAQKVRFLKESDRLYKTLFNSISHELRIPVATIMGASDSIIHSSNPEPIQTALCQEIFSASLRLNRLIENLLNISRLESGYLSIRLDWYDVNDLVNKVGEDLKDELKPFNFRIQISPDMPLVKIDFGLMEQVLYNILFNATQYAPAASDIDLHIGHNSKELLIEMMDKGPGFPESEIKNAFKKFFRVNGNKAGGLGLGLSIAKGFVEAHNGTIRVNNVEGAGAKFSINIPTELPEMKNL